MSFDSPLPPYNASDPSATFLNSSCLDLLLIELVPMAYRLANELQTGSDRDLVVAGKDGERGAGSTTTAPGAGMQRAAGGGGGGGAQSKLDEDEERDAVFYRLEMLGYRVGQGLVER
jgi:trafficking protein particle complex subunit 6